MLILVKLLTKYVIIIYALASVHEKFGVRIKAVPKSLQRRNSRPGWAKRTPEPFQIVLGVPNWFRRRTFHAVNKCIRFGSWKVRRLNRAYMPPNVVHISRESPHIWESKTVLDSRLQAVVPENCWHNLCIFYLYWRDTSIQGKGTLFWVPAPGSNLHSGDAFSTQ